MNMKIIDSVKAYKAPTAKVVKVNVQGVLCQSEFDLTQRQDWEDGGDI